MKELGIIFIIQLAVFSILAQTQTLDSSFLIMSLFVLEFLKQTIL